MGTRVLEPSMIQSRNPSDHHPEEPRRRRSSRPKTSGGSARARTRSRRTVFHLERVEERTLLSTIVVTDPGDTVANDGVVTLREAIQAANTNAAAGDANAGQGGGVIDQINFNIPGAGPHVISLTSSLP